MHKLICLKSISQTSKTSFGYVVGLCFCKKLLIVFVFLNLFWIVLEYFNVFMLKINF